MEGNNSNATRNSKVSAAVIDYRPEHQADFERLNRAWIEKYFRMEERDTYVLRNPEEAILQKGGAILMATYDGVVAGTVALLKVSNEEYEFSKMAVDEGYQRRGIAEALSYAALEKAKELGAKKVSLFSQTSLAPAIHLYRKLGFVEVPMNSRLYQRADIKMEIVVEEAE
ncbi:MAG TPA: GNAT family N-acetyltransferase [Flavisolibacter sp.]|jgi:ribosomal protein S18 acetylase RimI-like enzyme|nr:GNAT family N-acetyltransferase [Flavisolibacter sp.]